jgi:hypothetical protein
MYEVKVTVYLRSCSELIYCKANRIAFAEHSSLPITDPQCRLAVDAQTLSFRMTDHRTWFVSCCSWIFLISTGLYMVGMVVCTILWLSFGHVLLIGQALDGKASH